MNIIFHKLFYALAFLILFLSISSSQVAIRCLDNERQALLNFKHGIIAEEFDLMARTWGSQQFPRECCLWVGVECDNRTNHVISLDLHYIQGTISKSLLELHHLQRLDLSFCNFNRAPIPDFISSFTNLSYLDLHDAKFGGSIPRHLENLSNLMHLDLSSNELNGDLFELLKDLSRKLLYLNFSNCGLNGPFFNMSMFSYLEELDLSSNNLNGPVPEPYLRLPNLRILDISRNRLVGTLPDLVFCSKLKSLVLDDNMFNGTLPRSIGKLSQLETLSIGSNRLDEIITEAHMFNLSSLQNLDLSFNPRLTFKTSDQWLPPFRLKLLKLSDCKLGPNFPLWLKTQTDISSVDLSNTGISDSITFWCNGAWKLVDLDMSSNLLSGQIPNCLANMEQLAYLYLANNNFSGEIPLLCNPTLRLLDLSNNQLFGHVPNCFQNLWALSLANNSFSGAIPFLCNATFRSLDLSNNQFSGEIPNCFREVDDDQVALEYLNLANNYISGEIPFSIGSLDKLSILHLQNNDLSGELPISMLNCTNLKLIDLGNNKLFGNVPTLLGDGLLKLKVLVLSSNEFNGTIPSNICRLTNLIVLDFSLNDLSGAIPNCVYRFVAMTRKEEYFIENEDNIFSKKLRNWSTLLPSPIAPIPQEQLNSFEYAYLMWKGKEVKYTNHLGLVKMIDLSSNNLIGEIPSNITMLIGLVALNMSRNNLVGPIPRDIDQLNSLDSLDLSSNHLSGSIPSSLGALGLLGVLNLSNNNLSGRIPTIPKLSTFDEAFMGNPGLCGLPLIKSCPSDPTSSNDDHKSATEDNHIVTEEFYISLVIGFIVAFWGTFGTILLNRTIRHRFFMATDFVSLRMELTKARLQRFVQNQ